MSDLTVSEKKRRGRPPKAVVLVNEPSVVVSKKRGRPKLRPDVPSLPLIEKKRPGRPKKEEVKTKRRGRPKKSEARNTDQNIGQKEAKQKRRGRPKSQIGTKQNGCMCKTEFHVPEKVIVTKKHVSSGRTVMQEETEDTITVHVFQTNPSSIGINKKITKNLGDYESATIGVYWMRPCYVEEEQETVLEISKKIDDLITSEVISIVNMKRNMETK